jgi:hypothetical protein
MKYAVCVPEIVVLHFSANGIIHMNNMIGQLNDGNKCIWQEATEAKKAT